MHWALNPKSGIVRIYLSRKGGKGVVSVEDTVKLAILGLERYVLTSEKDCSQQLVDGDYEQHLRMTENN